MYFEEKQKRIILEKDVPLFIRNKIENWTNFHNEENPSIQIKDNYSNKIKNKLKIRYRQYVKYKHR